MGFSVLGPGYQALGFWVLGPWPWGPGSWIPTPRILCSGYRDLSSCGSRSWIGVLEYWIEDLGSWVESKVPDPGVLSPGILGPEALGVRSLVLGSWIQGLGFWIPGLVVLGSWVLRLGSWVVVSWILRPGTQFPEIFGPGFPGSLVLGSWGPRSKVLSPGFRVLSTWVLRSGVLGSRVLVSHFRLPFQSAGSYS